MTALAIRPAAGRTRSAWVIYRQYRVAFLGVLVLYGAFATVLLATGFTMHRTARDLGLDHCTSRCTDALDAFTARYEGLSMLVTQLLVFSPALVGAFLGGPLLAREYESGTFRFAWTQGTGRTRWAVTRLLALGLGLTAVALALSRLYDWWYSPFVPFMGRFDRGGSYEVAGTVFAAHVLLAFCLGALAGVLLRRTVAAVVAALAGWFAVVFPLAMLWRPRFMTPLVGELSKDGPTRFAGADWHLDIYMTDPTGAVVSQSAQDRLIDSLLSTGQRPGEWFAQHGYITWQQYHPASRFWPFQLIESGILAAVALAAATLTVHLIKRR
jgi:hypothetical protein